MPTLRGSGHVPAAVDVDGLAGDVVGFGEEDGGAACFVGVAKVAEWNFFGRGVEITGHHVGFEQRWGDRVGRNALLGEEIGVGVGETDEAGFGSGIVRTDDAAGLRGYRREIDDAAPAALAHVGKNALRDEKGRSEIDAEHALPIFESDFSDGLGLRNAGVVDEDFHFAELALSFGDEPLDVSGNGHISLNGNGAATELFNGRTNFFRGNALLMVIDCDVAASIGQRQRDGFANPTRCAANECNVILE